MDLTCRKNTEGHTFKAVYFNGSIGFKSGIHRRIEQIQGTGKICGKVVLTGSIAA